MSQELFFGVMTGTSADAIDVVLLSISKQLVEIVDSESVNFTDDLKTEIESLCQPSSNELFRAHTLGVRLSLLTANIINTIMLRNSLSPTNISAIGFHGQTLRHHPECQPPFSIQIGCPSTLAHHTKIKTIADFRMADIAAEGQGAPLVPAFHQAVFHSPHENRIILNIGGIANITFLPAETELEPSGFDTGPGNTLLDSWIFQHKGKNYDSEGSWARKGEVNQQLLKLMLQDAYITKLPPKSTGKEYFNLNWLSHLLQTIPETKAEDVQRTLLEFTCISISENLKNIIATSTSNKEFYIYLCGGGINNTFLVERLSYFNQNTSIQSTSALGIHPQQVEASAFAWLASRTNAGLHGNLRSATGAKSDKVLGGIFSP